MKKPILFIATFILSIGVVFSQPPTADFYVTGTASIITKSKFNSTGASKALYGQSITTSGKGVYGTGGFGAKGDAVVTGSGNRFGAYGQALNGSIANYGVFGIASGTSPFAGYFSGNVYCTGSYLPSDANLKEDIRPLENTLDKLITLRAISFQYDSTKVKFLPSGRKDGLVAQNVQNIFPECVSEIPIPMESQASKGPTKVMAVNYDAFIPIMINALQSQKKDLDEIARQIGE